MTEPTLDRLTENGKLAMLWATGTAVGGAAGAVLCHMLLGDGPEGLAFVFGVPVIMGGAIGLGQWLGVRKALPISQLWVACVIAGWLVAPYFYFHPTQSSFGGSFGGGETDEWRTVSMHFRWPLVAVPSAGAFAGIAAGILQAIFFPKIVRSRALWIVASSAGYFFSGLFALFFGHPLFSLLYDARGSFYGSPVRDVIEAALPLAEPAWYGGILGLGAALATAIPLARPVASPQRARNGTPSQGASPAPAPAVAPPVVPAPEPPETSSARLLSPESA
ncbi:MAG: hypothetical protein U0166_22320 [Acidobacteriota bacterium]